MPSLPPVYSNFNIFWFDAVYIWNILSPSSSLIEFANVLINFLYVPRGDWDCCILLVFLYIDKYASNNLFLTACSELYSYGEAFLYFSIKSFLASW